MRNLALALFMLVACSVHAQNYKFGKISKEELQQTQHPKDPEADAAILYRNVHTEFEYNEDKGFYLVTEVHERVKIYNEDGFDFGTKEVALYRSSYKNKEEFSGLKAFTYNLDANGKVEDTKLKSDGVFEEKRSKFREVTKFTMPALKAGSVVEYRYRVRSPFIGNIDTYSFQETIPVNRVELQFEAPEYFIFKTHRRGWHPYNIDMEKYDRTMNYRQTYTALETGEATGETVNRELKFKQNIYRVKISDVPAIKEEAYAGNIDNYKTSLKFELEYTRFPNSPLKTYATDWEAVAKSINDSEGFGGQMERTKDFAKELDAAMADAQDNTQKMIAIYEFAKAKMNWNGYVGYYADEGVKEAYKNGTGNTADINLMLTAMFRYAGLNANPILISTKSNGIPIFPTRNGFNYVISSVQMGDQFYMFDATTKHGSPNVLNERLLNWQGRLVRQDGTSDWVRLHPGKNAVQSVMVNAKLSDDLTEMVGTAKSQFTGNLGLIMRDSMEGLSPVDASSKVESLFHDIRVSNVSTVQLENPYKPLKVDFEFDATNCVEEIGGNLYLSPMAFLSLEENPFKMEQRAYPIDYGYAVKDRYIINIDIPEGYKVESLPQGANVTVGENNMGFKYLISEANNKIQLMVDFSINQYFVSPDNYEDVKQFYQFVLEKEGEQVVLSKV